MIRGVLWIVIFGLGLAGCANMERSQSSGYANRNSDVSSSSPSPKENSDESYDDSTAISRRAHLRHLEGRLEGKRERDQYSKILPWLQSDEEKIKFLTVDGIDNRQAWINSHEIWKRSQATDPEIKTVVEAGDISMGMQMDLVKKAWGEPQSVEVSGNPLFHNERWKYQRFVSSQDGYHKEKRSVYFEGGRVVGWDTE